MKILLFTTNTNNSDCPPLGQCLLKAYVEQRLEKEDLDIKVFSHKQFKKIQLLKEIINYKPDVLGIGCYVWNMNDVMDICKDIRRLLPDIQIILGGPSISFHDLELDLLIQEDVINYMIVGEGEVPFYELIRCLYNSDKTHIGEIPNLISKQDNSKICKNMDCVRVCDLNTLPNPYLMYSELQDNARRSEIIYLETSRGCPYNCAYCVSAKTQFRHKSIEVVMDELGKLYELGFNRISVLDSTLNYNLDRTKELLREIIKNKWKLILYFEIKAECLDEELIDLFLDAGVEGIEIGLQSSKKNTLKLINRYHDDIKFEDNIKKLVQKNIRMVVDLIIGLPYETLEDWYASLDYCFKLGDIRISSMLLKIFPNTKIYNDAYIYGYEYDKTRLNQIIYSNTMTKEQIEFALKVSYIVNIFWSLEVDNDRYMKALRYFLNNYFEKVPSELFIQLTKYIYRNNLSGKLNMLTTNEKLEMIKVAVNR